MTNKDKKMEGITTLEVTRETKEEANIDINESKSRQEEILIREWLEKVKFRKKFFGSDEADVWKKIQELNEKYEEALKAERIRYEVLLEERCKKRQESSSE